MIGTGLRGQHTLGGILKQPNVKIVALCDIKPDRLDKAATLTARDKPNTYTDYRKLLDRKDLDAVFIDTPCYLHSEMAIAALQAGKHVYCEKPVGITPKQVQDVLNAAREVEEGLSRSGSRCAPSAWLAEAIQKIRDGVAGDVVMVKAQRHASWDLDHNGSSADWFFDAKRSGDVIVEMAVHNLDLCNWAIGSRPTKACGFRRNADLEERPARPHQHGRLYAQLRVSERREDVVHAELLSSVRAAGGRAVHQRLRHEGRRQPGQRQVLSAGARRAAGSY